jgi:hypothetical protein
VRRERVLLPGIIVLARLVARVREAATDRLYDTVAAAVAAEQERALVATLAVPEGSRVSALDAWGRGPRSASGKSMIAALTRVEQIAALRMRQLDLRAVPVRRLVQLGRYGMAAKAPALRRHPRGRRTATALATVRALESRAVDDAPELFDVLMIDVLAGRASRLAAAVEVLLEASEWGEGEQMPLELVWDAIENVVSRSERRAAVETKPLIGHPPRDPIRCDDPARGQRDPPCPGLIPSR